MLFDQRDLDLLRLIGLCKDIPADCSPLRCDMFSQTEFSLLAGAGYICKSKSGLSYRLTDKGHSLLDCLGFPSSKDKYPVGNMGVLRRRREVAKVILSLYRASVDIFDEGKADFKFTPSFSFRRNRRAGILGASRMCGLLYSKTQTAPVYFISHDTQFNTTVELPAIRRVSALLQSPEEIILIFFSDDETLLETFTNSFDFLDIRSLWGDTFSLQTSWNLYEPPVTPLEISLYA